MMADFEELIHQSMMEYSMLDLIQQGLTSEEEFLDALKKVIRISQHGGFHLTHHFTRVYAYDPATGSLYVDWLMSRRGLKMIILQYPER